MSAAADFLKSKQSKRSWHQGLITPRMAGGSASVFEPPGFAILQNAEPCFEEAA